MKSLAVLIAFMSTQASADPPLENRYDGPRLSFAMPKGATVNEVEDVSGAYAVEISPNSDSKLALMRILVSQNKVSEVEAEALAHKWRDARLRNRASWGVAKRGDSHLETLQIGGHRFIRFVDEMGSKLGATRQIFLCAAITGRLACVIGGDLSADDRKVETALRRVAETLVVKR